MEILGFLAMIAMGVTLSLMGGGGSVLTVPVLVYFFKLPADVATRYSLFLVGITAIFGSYQYIKTGQIAYRVGLIFSVPAFLGVFVVRRFLMPHIPDVLDAGIVTVSRDELILILFALLMIFASLTMIRKTSVQKKASEIRKGFFPLIFAEGFLVGGLTGLVGAGGGFMMIPALVILAGLPMKTAVGTSLLVIAAKSLPGFFSDPGVHGTDWMFLGQLSVCAFVGIFIGSILGKRVSSELLKPMFGYLILLMGSFILIQQSFS